MTRTAFTPIVAERLGYYVYLLADPRSDEVFYVGKGKGDRVFAHVAAAVEDDSIVSPKLDRIRDIHGAGLEVVHEFIRICLNEATAFEVESACIQMLGMDHLHNAVLGHHVAIRGRMSIDVAVSLFDAEPAPPLNVPALLIRIPKLWHPGMSAAELYEATHGWWKIGPRREKAQYALSVNRGVIREVYRIRPGSWRQQAKGDRGWLPGTDPTNRWGFDGDLAPELEELKNHSVKHLLKRGMASPVLYLNC